LENQNKYHSLHQVLSSVSRMFDKYWSKAIWVKAEIAKLNFYPHSGHCYPLLVEKSNGSTIAEVRSTMWSGVYQKALKDFKKITNSTFGDGQQLLMLVEVKFSQVYGLSLNIIEIDPSFTLGLMEKERLECIARLKKENIFDANKKIALPSLLKKIAIISVETSKGYMDFCNTIDARKADFMIEHDLFPALLQGDKAVDSMRNQLDEIRQRKHEFDAVFIIRGGGGEVGLNCYDNYRLASYVARFPLPILTGIGHASNQTVTEQISNQNLITPTALANFVLEQYHNYSDRIRHAKKSINRVFDKFFQVESMRIESISSSLKSSSKSYLKNSSQILDNSIILLERKSRNKILHAKSEMKTKVDRLSWLSKNKLHNQSELLIHRFSSLQRSISSILEKNNQGVLNIESKVKILHPNNTLQRGYAILKSADKSEITQGTSIEIQTYDAILQAEVKNIKSKDGKKN
jgi:exodeoxyribonuclease VII large subunit